MASATLDVVLAMESKLRTNVKSDALRWNATSQQFERFDGSAWQACVDVPSDVVHKAGAETITGAKTFSGGLSGNLTGDVTGNCSGSSGSCTGNAATATALATARSLQTSLASGTAASFDGSADASIGVTGVLPVANGGTGSSSLDSLISQILLAAHPVGSYYWSSESTDPSTLFGGTWTQITDRFVYAASSAGTTGGSSSASYTPSGSVGGHSLTTSEIPAHSHGRGSQDITGAVTQASTGRGPGLSGSGAFAGDGNLQPTVSHSPDSSWKPSYGVNFTASTSWSGVSESIGGGGSHNHGFTGTAASIATMPPYVTAYCWRRTA